MALVELSPNTEYFFEVTSADADGNTSTDDNGGSFYSFTTEDDDILALGGGDILRDPDSGSVRKAFVGIWNVNPVTGTTGTLDADPFTGPGVTLTQQGSGKEILLTTPTSDEGTLNATGDATGTAVYPIVKWPGRENRYGTLDDIEDGARVVVILHLRAFVTLTEPRELCP